VKVTRAAEECAMLLARIIAPDRTIQVLLPVIESEEYPINLAAIKMMTQLVENCSNDVIIDFLPDMIPVLLKVSVTFYDCILDTLTTPWLTQWTRILTENFMSYWWCLEKKRQKKNIVHKPSPYFWVAW